MVRLIASDIDGTLVKDNTFELDPEYFNVIRELMDRGVIFCACSGRQYYSMHQLFEPIADQIYFICENGPILRTTKGILFKWGLPAGTYREYLADIRALNGPYAVVGTPDCSYVDCGEDHELFRMLKEDMRFAVKNVADLNAIPEEDVVKVTIYHPTDVVTACEPLMAKGWKERLHITQSGHVWIDAVAPNSSKGEAYALLQEYLEIPKEDTVYFGDNLNDLSAFGETGTSVTVSNARKEVLDKADVIQRSYAHNGVMSELNYILYHIDHPE